MAHIVTLDVETQKSFSDLTDRKPSKLGLSYVGIYSTEGGVGGFFEAEVAGLWPILEQADRIVGFNIDRFDMPVLSPYYSGEVSDLPTFDLLTAVKDSLGFRVGLGKIAMATLGQRKTGTGWDALRWYAEGKMKKIKEYCDMDVKVTWELYSYAVEYGELKYPDNKGNLVKFKVVVPPVEAETDKGIQTTLAI